MNLKISERIIPQWGLVSIKEALYGLDCNSFEHEIICATLLSILNSFCFRPKKNRFVTKHTTPIDNIYWVI